VIAMRGIAGYLRLRPDVDDDGSEAAVDRANADFARSLSASAVAAQAKSNVVAYPGLILP
jgi:hypothetical protein